MHPLDQFKFCPVCGSPDFRVQDGKSKRCNDCDFEYFLNPSAATVAFIFNEKQELLVERRKRNPFKGTLDLPGGFADIGETAEAGIAREVKEETGLKVISAKYLFSLPNTYLYSGMEIPTLDLFFLCKTDDPCSLRASDDAAEVMWLPLRHLTIGQFGLSSIRKGLLQFLQWQQSLTEKGSHQ